MSTSPIPRSPSPQPPQASPEAGAAAGQGFGQLLRRYLLPVGLCVAPSGELFTDHAMLQRNKQSLKRWMPHYARVHMVLAASLLGICSGAHAAQAPGWLVAAVAVPTAVEVVLAVVFGSIALVLRLGND
jgi:hypothetical protein